MNLSFAPRSPRTGHVLATLLLLCLLGAGGLLAVLPGPAAADDEATATPETTEPEVDDTPMPAPETETRTLYVVVEADDDASVSDWTVYIMSADGSAVLATGPGQAAHTAAPGETYRLAQEAPDGYAFDELHCEAGGVSIPLTTGPDANGTATVTVPLEVSEDIVCRFVNMKGAVLASGLLTIDLIADGTGEQPFGVTVVDPASGGIVDGFLLAGGQTVGPVPLVAGSYNVRHTRTPDGVPGSWNLVDVMCSNGEAAWNPAVDDSMPDHWQISLDIEAGADVECSFHVASMSQPQTGHVVVVKHELGDVSAYRPWQFSLRSAAGEAAFAHNNISPVSLLVTPLDNGEQRQLDGAGQLSFQEVDPGQYSVREVNGSAQRCYQGSEFETVWAFSDDMASATYGTESSTFNVADGERVEVHFFNRRCNNNGSNGGTLVIGKVNIGGNPMANFTVSVAGVNDNLTISAVKPATVTALAPGEYMVTEAPAAGYTRRGWSLVKGGEACPMGPQHNGPVATVTVQAGSPTILCFYNEAVPAGSDDDDGDPATPLPPSTGTGSTPLGSTSVLRLIVLGTAAGIGAGVAADLATGRRSRRRAG